MLSRIVMTLVFALLVTARTTCTWAADSTVTTPNATLRLLDGGMTAGAGLAGVALELAPGWKTYWRVPGDTGVPPDFDWSGSTNVAKAEVLWPAPHRMSDGQGGEVIGYTDTVVFPVRVTASDPAKPVALHLRLHYAVCHDICLPGDAELALPLGEGADKPAITAGLSTVPVDDPNAPLSVAKAALDSSGTSPALVLELAGTDVSPKADILVEGPAIAYFGAPVDGGPLTDGHGRRFTLPVSVTGDAAALRGAQIVLTVLDGETRLVRQATIR
ncbi:MAG: protein-disulfide reductase DsbD family protein [Hyphomicrobiales bacterium]